MRTTRSAYKGCGQRLEDARVKNLLVHEYIGGGPTFIRMKTQTACVQEVRTKKAKGCSPKSETKWGFLCPLLGDCDPLGVAPSNQKASKLSCNDATL